MKKKDKNRWGDISYKDVIGPIVDHFYDLCIPDSTDTILSMWTEPHRYYHGPNHLSEIFELMRKHGEWTPEKGYNKIMFYSAIFHDIVYDPTRDDNEEKSVEIFKSYAKKMIPQPDPDEIRIICDIIMDTKTGITKFDYSKNKKFISFDRYNLLYGSFNEVLSKTMLLFKEEQFMNYPEWKEKTIKFLSQFEDTNPNIKYVIDYLNMWTPKIGVYCGSFNKFHLGHYNILQKSERIFDKVIIARGINTDKKNEIHNLPETLKYHQIEKYDGLLTDFIDSLGYDVVLIRGLRNSNDFENEKIQYQYLQDLKPDLNVVNIICDKEFEHISSSAIRTLEKFGKGGNYLLEQFD